MPSDKPKVKCPTPTKKKLRQDEAISVALTRSRVAGRPMSTYRCVCGAFHISSSIPNWSSLK